MYFDDVPEWEDVPYHKQQRWTAQGLSPAYEQSRWQLTLDQIRVLPETEHPLGLE